MDFKSDVFSKFNPINITPDFVEPAKIVNCSKDSSSKQVAYLAEKYSISRFSSVDDIMESNFQLSLEDKENLKKKNYDWFNEMLTLNYNEQTGVFDISDRALFVFSKDKTQLAVVQIESSEFDEEEIKDTFCFEVYDESSEKKKSYFKNESFIFLKKSKADYFEYGHLNDSLTKEASPSQKKEFIEELKSYIKNKEEDEF